MQIKVRPYRGIWMTKIAHLQKYLEEIGLKHEEDFFLSYSVRDLVTIDLAVLHNEKKIAFMSVLNANQSQKLTNLGWKPAQIPKLKILTRQWVKNVLG